MSSITDSAKFNDNSAYYQSITGSGPSSGVTQLIAGDGITLSPAGGTGIVTVTSGNIVTAGTGQDYTVTPTPTFWEIGNFLFCSILIRTNFPIPGSGALGCGRYTLPSGYAWTSGSQASWPVIICSPTVGTLTATPVVEANTFVSNGQTNQPLTGINNNICIQAVNGEAVGQDCYVNVLAFGPKAPPA